METRQIGSLQVSVIGLGCNQVGTTCDLPASRDIIAAAIDHGITFFDTADEYGDGRSEEVLGPLLTAHRNKIVLGTKFGAKLDGDPARAGASARWIERAVEDSLRRLCTDRIDLYQLHFPDTATPMEETLAALDRLVRSGKVREIGACNLPAAAIDEAAGAASALGTARFRSYQARLNLLRQEALAELVPACARNQIRFIPYFPLASGLLTGKYRRGHPPAAGSRLAENVPAEVAAKVLSDAAFDRLEALEALAAQHGHSLLDLAIAWLTAQPQIASVICGATSARQVAANVAGAGWLLDDGLAAEAGRLGAGA
jgi:aryl-alcohol dehydrogenase-like predicted oxidoreductase